MFLSRDSLSWSMYSHSPALLLCLHNKEKPALVQVHHPEPVSGRQVEGMMSRSVCCSCVAPYSSSIAEGSGGGVFCFALRFFCARCEKSVCYLLWLPARFFPSKVARLLATTPITLACAPAIRLACCSAAAQCLLRCIDCVCLWSQYAAHR